MSLERLALGTLLPSFSSPEAPAWVLRRLEEGLAGVTYFADNVASDEQLAALSARLRAVRPEAVLAIDEEGGDVTRLDAGRGSSMPGHLALGVVDDVAVTRAVAGAIGARLASVGVTLDLAPVADVNSDPRNPVIGVRSFGADPQLVGRHVAAFVTGLQEAGVAACAKHFPGHGDTTVDSHAALPRVDAAVETLRERELVPFRAAIAADVAAVMTAHVVVPAVDPRPATIAPGVLGLLREELGFEGVVVSDALEMRGLADGFGVLDGAVLALAAGVDALCVGHDLHEEAVDALTAAIAGAVRAGRLGEERLAEAAARVERLGLRPPAGPAARALRIAGDVSLVGAPLVVELVPPAGMAAGPMPFGLADALRERDAGVVGVELRRGDGELPELDDRPLVVALRDAGRHHWQRRVADELLHRRPDAVVVETGLPSWLPAAASRTIETHGAGRASLEAAAAALLPRRLRP